MINFNKLNNNELKANGLCFETPEESDLFIDIVKAELEVRIGKAISKKVGEPKIFEFDKCEKGMESKWLEENCPDFREIVEAKQKELAKEIEKYKNKISGLLPE